MARKVLNRLKLGLFVMAGLAFLIMLLYVIGKNQNLFGNTFQLKARFENIYGLMPGNNIRFAGIDAGTVKNIQVINDTTIEVTLSIKTKMKKYIRKNALVSIGTDGLMGNKLLNIQSVKSSAPLVQEGDILYSTKGSDTDEMLEVLNTTNNDIAIIAKDLKQTVQRINDSKAFWNLLNDEGIPADLRTSLSRAKAASDKLNNMMVSLNSIVDNVKTGKGSVGILLTDTSIAANIKESVANMKETVQKFRKVGEKADTLSFQLSELVNSVSKDVNEGDGAINALLKNKEMTDRFNNTLKNIEQGTQAFNDNMEALKHNFLFRGYFKKLENQKKKQESPARY